MYKKFTKWEDFEKELNINQEQETEIQLEMDIIRATIEARKNSKLSQRELSKRTGIKQPAIARIESYASSPNTNTLIRLLYPIGYTIKVVPLSKNEKKILKNKDSIEKK